MQISWRWLPAALALAASTAQAQQEVIAFHGFRPAGLTELGLWSIPASGGTASRVVTGVEYPDLRFGNPYGAWFPNGAQVTFKGEPAVSGTGPTNVLYRTTPAGAPLLRVITNGTPAARGRWSISRDGQSIAYVADLDPVFDVAVVNVATGVAVNRTTDGGYKQCPSFSPNGQTIAYLRENLSNGSGDLYTVGTFSGAPVLVGTGFTVGDDAPQWLPDGSAVVVETVEGVPVRVDLSTGAVTPLSDGSYGMCQRHQLSPDGATLAATCNVPGDPSTLLVLFPVTATGLTQGTTAIVASDVASYQFGPSWSPDGSRLAYVYGDYATGQTGVGVVVPWTEPQRLTAPGELTVQSVFWQPAIATASIAVKTATYDYRARRLGADVAGTTTDVIRLVGFQTCVPTWVSGAKVWRFGCPNPAPAPAPATFTACSFGGCATLP